MTIASLNDFIDPDLSTADVLHSSGYAAAAGGAGADGLSLEKRRELRNKEDRNVGDYLLTSRLGQQKAAIKARTVNQKFNRAFDASSGTFSDKAGFSNRRGGGIRDRSQIDTASIQRREHFIEPQARMHDPYA